VIGIAGPGLVILLSTWALHGSEIAWVYALANGLIGMTWSFGIPYLLGMCAQFDQTGQSAALGGIESRYAVFAGDGPIPGTVVG
jgi:hypothetical protein